MSQYHGIKAMYVVLVLRALAKKVHQGCELNNREILTDGKNGAK